MNSQRRLCPKSAPNYSSRQRFQPEEDHLMLQNSLSFIPWWSSVGQELYLSRMSFEVTVLPVTEQGTSNSWWINGKNNWTRDIKQNLSSSFEIEKCGLENHTSRHIHSVWAIMINEWMNVSPEGRNPGTRAEAVCLSASSTARWRWRQDYDSAGGESTWPPLTRASPPQGLLRAQLTHPTGNQTPGKPWTVKIYRHW